MRGNFPSDSDNVPSVFPTGIDNTERPAIVVADAGVRLKNLVALIPEAVEGNPYEMRLGKIQVRTCDLGIPKNSDVQIIFGNSELGSMNMPQACPVLLTPSGKTPFVLIKNEDAYTAALELIRAYYSAQKRIEGFSSPNLLRPRIACLYNGPGVKKELEFRNERLLSQDEWRYLYEITGRNSAALAKLLNTGFFGYRGAGTAEWLPEMKDVGNSLTYRLSGANEPDVENLKCIDTTTGSEGIGLAVNFNKNEGMTLTSWSNARMNFVIATSAPPQDKMDINDPRKLNESDFI